MKVSAFSIVLSLILYLSTFHSGCGDYGACTKRSDCCENMACVKNECSPCNPDGSECQTDTCCDGFYCENGACTICPTPDVTSCAKDSDCKVGQNCKDLKCHGGLCIVAGECLQYYAGCDFKNDKCCPGLGCYLGGDKCSYPKSLGQFCGSDSECVEGYKCSSSNKCELCGSTAPCSKDSNCCGDLTCVNKKCHDKNGDDCFGLNSHCVSNDNCCPGLRCSNGQCKGCKIGGFGCSPEDQNCCTGYVCNKSSKQCELCPSSTDKAHACNSNADCTLGGCTNTLCVGNVCLPSGYCLDGSNGICNSNEQCCKGLVCKVGNCVSCHGSGQTCSESVDCCNGYWCSGGKCKSCCGSQCEDDENCKNLCSGNLKCIDDTCQPP